MADNEQSSTEIQGNEGESTDMSRRKFIKIGAGGLAFIFNPFRSFDEDIFLIPTGYFLYFLNFIQCFFIVYSLLLY